MRFVIVTGMSGGGKRTALKMLEDAGFFCVDNLPIPLLEKFVELIAMPGQEISKVALGLDVRTDQSFQDVERSFEYLEQNGYRFEILFMEASDAVLIRRYKESRRMHPLASYEGGRVEDGIRRERKVLESMKKKADYVIAYVHWGTEYSTELEDAQKTQARDYINAGADVVVGAHTHCLQGMEWYKGVPIFYSLGNFWFNERTLYTTVLEIDITKEGRLSAKMLPCLQKGKETRLLSKKKQKQKS